MAIYANDAIFEDMIESHIRQNPLAGLSSADAREAAIEEICLGADLWPAGIREDAESEE